jgi:hypothetical protein
VVFFKAAKLLKCFPGRGFDIAFSTLEPHIRTHLFALLICSCSHSMKKTSDVLLFCASCGRAFSVRNWSTSSLGVCNLKWRLRHDPIPHLKVHVWSADSVRQ